MKNKKKVILMLCALLAVAMVLVGCGSSDNKFVGTWTLDSAEASGLKLRPKSRFNPICPLWI